VTSDLLASDLLASDLLASDLLASDLLARIGAAYPGWRAWRTCDGTLARPHRV